MKSPSYLFFSIVLFFQWTSFGANQPNVLLICIDDLRPELSSFGVDYIQSPNIDSLAEQGRVFTQHYVNAPSCGPSRYTMLTGRYGPAKNDALFIRAEKLKGKNEIPPSMPEWFRTHGYTTVSVGKVSHHPGGMGGADWNDVSELEIPDAWDRHLLPVAEWQHPRGMMHGLAHGEIRIDTGDMDLFQTMEGPDEIYPDGHIVNTALDELSLLADDSDKPFFLAIGLLKPHLPFGVPQQYLDLYDGIQIPEIPHSKKPTIQSTWHGSGEFMHYNRWGKDPREDHDFAIQVKRHYAACVSFADTQVGKILAKLKESGADQNTIIVLWGDHGWNLGEHGIWGKHNLFEEALRSPLIVYAPDMVHPGVRTDAVVETLDIFPTLCEMTGVEIPDFVHGSSLETVIQDPDSLGHPAIAYWREANTIRTDRFRMTLHKNNYVELYDHQSPDEETVNVAEKYPDIIQELTRKLATRLTLRSHSINGSE